LNTIIPRIKTKNQTEKFPDVPRIVKLHIISTMSGKKSDINKKQIRQQHKHFKQNAKDTRKTQNREMNRTGQSVFKFYGDIFCAAARHSITSSIVGKTRPTSIRNREGITCSQYFFNAELAEIRNTQNSVVSVFLCVPR